MPDMMTETSATNEDTQIDSEVHPVEESGVSEEEGAAIVAEARENLVACISVEGDFRDKAVEDLEFRVGNQWPGDVRAAREASKQPCLQFNLIPKFVRQVTGDARQNVPGVNVVPENSQASKEVADILKGVIRYIEHSSVASYVYSKGLDQSASCGRGWWRVDVDYDDDETFDQNIKILPIVNSLAVYVDPCAIGPTYQNAQWYIVRQWQNLKAFERENPGKQGQPTALDGAPGNHADWFGKDAVCIAEYWRRESVNETLLEIQVFPAPAVEGAQAPKPFTTVIKKSVMLEKFPNVNIVIKRKRTMKRSKVVCYTITGSEVLHKREWPGQYIPIIPVLGEEIHIDGKDYLSGIIRDMKDPQRAYNYWMTMLTEQVALAPKVPWMVTDAMIADYKQEWDNMNNANYPYIRFKPDPAQPNGPQRPLPAQLSQGYAQMMEIAQGALNDTSGIFKPALGQESNETSGRAILARQKEGDTGTYVYIANWLLSVQFTGQIIVDLVPKIFDTERVLMILDDEEEPQQITVNKHYEVDGVNKIYDVRQGKYGVRVTSGPSYATRRQESANSQLEFLRLYPDAAPIIGPRLAKAMDWEGAEEIAEELKQLGIRQGLIPPDPVAPGAQPPMAIDPTTGQPIPMAPGMPPGAPQGAPVSGPAAQEQGIDQLLAQTGPQFPVV